MPDRQLEERISQLEETVRRLEAQVASLSPRRGPAPPRPRGPAPRRKAGPAVPDALKDARYWFRILGIGLLLLGVVFIFKYSAEESRAMMALRVTVGAVMGLALIAIGFLLRNSERHFASVLSGGGIGVWYITGFAAFQIFNLVGAAPAFAFMTAVTIFAFVLSLRQNVVALAVIGALGGLGTPWLLYETDRALIWPVLYMCLVLTGAIGVYARRGWKALSWSSALVAGGAFIAIGARYYVDEAGVTSDKLSLQIGLAFFWLIYAVVPAVRESRLRLTAPEPEAKAQLGKTKPLVLGDSEVFTTLIAIYGVGMTTATWEPNWRIGGWVGVATAVAYLLAWRWFEARPALTTIARAHLMGALILVTSGLSLLLDGEVLLFTLAAEAAAIHFLSRGIQGKLLPAWAHLMYLVLGTIALGRIAFDSTSGTPLVNSESLTNGWIIASALVASFTMRTNTERFSYRYMVHALALLWILRELHDIPNGQGIVSIIWGLYAIVLVVLGLKLPSTKLRVLGIITLVLTVLKLVLVDLEDVKAIWRVLLFSGFGAVLLYLSHWSQRYKGAGGSNDPVEEKPAGDEA